MAGGDGGGTNTTVGKEATISTVSRSDSIERSGERKATPAPMVDGVEEFLAAVRSKKGHVPHLDWAMRFVSALRDI